MIPNILIVDGNHNASLLKEEFLKSDYSIDIAKNIEDTFERFQELSPDLVLINFNSPEIAMKITRQLVEFDHTVCVIAMTNSVNSLVREEAFSAGARALIEYPNSPSDNIEVSETINSIIKTCQLLQEENCMLCWKCNLFMDMTVIPNS